MTLIEVMLALAIMLLSMVAVGQLVNMGSDQSTQARWSVRATRLAEAKMAEVEVGVVSISEGGQGTFDNDDSAWSWSVDPQPAGPPNLYRVDVKVSRTDGRPFEFTLSRMIYDPALVGSAAQAEQPSDSATTDTTGMGGTSP